MALARLPLCNAEAKEALVASERNAAFWLSASNAAELREIAYKAAELYASAAKAAGLAIMAPSAA